MKQTTIAILIGLFLFSCKKDIEDFEKLKNKEFSVVDWEPTFVAPLVNSETTLGEIYSDLDTLIERLEEDENLRIYVNSDNLFVLSYEDSVETDDINSYYDIPDVTESFSLDIPQSGLSNIQAVGLTVGNTFTDVWDTTFVLTMETSYGALLKEAIFDGGEMTLEYESDINQDLEVTATINSLTNLNTGETVVFDLGTSNKSGSEEFTNHEADLFAENLIGDERYNTFEINVKVSGTVTNTVLTGSSVDVTASVSDYNICYIEGQLGDFEARTISDQLKFDIFSDDQIKGIHFRDPSITLAVENTAGLPFTATIVKLDVGYLNDADQSLGVDGDKIEVDGVADLSDIPDNPATAEPPYVLDNTSGLDDVFVGSPNKLLYEVEITSENSATDDFDFFLSKDSKVKVNILAELPADFSVSNFEYIDTADFNGDDIEFPLIDNFENAALKIVVNNQLPLETNVQGYILDSNDVVIDSLFSEGFETILANNNVNDEGVVLEPEVVVSVIEVDKNKFENIMMAKKIIYVGRASTENSMSNSFNDVKILSNYVFGIKAGILASFSVDLNEELELNETK